jgi:guanine deaminase
MATDQTLFALLLALRQPAITGVFVRGRRVLAPE